MPWYWILGLVVRNSHACYICSNGYPNQTIAYWYN